MDTLKHLKYILKYTTWIKFYLYMWSLVILQFLAKIFIFNVYWFQILVTDLLCYGYILLTAK